MTPEPVEAIARRHAHDEMQYWGGEVSSEAWGQAHADRGALLSALTAARAELAELPWLRDEVRHLREEYGDVNTLLGATLTALAAERQRAEGLAHHAAPRPTPPGEE